VVAVASSTSAIQHEGASNLAAVSSRQTWGGMPSISSLTLYHNTDRFAWVTRVHGVRSIGSF
jgi:hypothetical protein